MVRFGHQSLPTFGVGRERSKTEWQSIIRQLVASGFLWLDIGGYGGLKITAKGTALLRGEGTFLCCKDTVPVRSGLHPPRVQSDKTLSNKDALLLHTLKTLRLEIATDRGVPPYAVFPDRALIDMVHRRPKSEAEFMEVNGVGAAKLEQFGATFLEAIAGEDSNGEILRDKSGRMR